MTATPEEIADAFRICVPGSRVIYDARGGTVDSLPLMSEHHELSVWLMSDNGTRFEVPCHQVHVFGEGGGMVEIKV